MWYKSGLALALSVMAFPSCVSNRNARDDSPQRLEFHWETQNLRVIETQLWPDRGPLLKTVCPELEGKLLFGRIPHRLAGEPATSKEHFIDFVAAYGAEPQPSVVVDLDENHDLACEERVEFLTHPQNPELVFRSIDVYWKRDDGPAREIKYRLILPTRLGNAAGDRFMIDVVDVPVARWAQNGQESLWMLYDGNYNGMFDRQFGDGFLIDATGLGPVSLDPYGGNFFSYHAPIDLPWGAFEVAEVDLRGRFLDLRPLAASAATGRLPVEEGQLISDMACRSFGGESVPIGGATGRYQIVYFWLSNCPTCQGEAEELTKLIETIGWNRVSIVGISLDEQRGLAERFSVFPHPMWLHCFEGRTLWDNAFARRFDARRPGTFLFIDPEGRLVTRGLGYAALRDALSVLSERS